MDVTVGTFNLNNLFDRFNFRADLGALPARERNVRTTFQWEFVGQGAAPGDPPPLLDGAASSTPIVRIQKNANGTLLRGKPDDAQQSLATRIAAMDVDVLAVQEVENIDALRRFNRDFLANSYEFEVLIEGNDPRFIDVGLLSRLPVANVSSHRFDIHPDDPSRPIFGRDLLEVDVLNATRGRRLFKIFVNHLKSNFVRFNHPDPAAAQAQNRLRRTRQSEIVERIVDARTRTNTPYVVLGDMNDAPGSATLAPMVGGLNLVDALANAVESQLPPTVRNAVDAPPANGRWTHRLSVTNAPDRFELLDQIWVSQPLAGRIAHAEINRRPRWSASSQGVGSDHDPAFVRLSGF